jgi:hypothetical protein
MGKTVGKISGATVSLRSRYYTFLALTASDIKKWFLAVVHNVALDVLVVQKSCLTRKRFCDKYTQSSQQRPKL